MNSIPLDLVYEIFCRLPTKSIGRCRCVSKKWRSILCSEDFTDYFLTKSSTRPSLLFTMDRSSTNEFLFFSPSQIQSRQNDKLSSLAAAPYFKLNLRLKFCRHAAGLFCFPYFTRKHWEHSMHHVICNPSLGQYVFLPTLKTTSNESFLGFDPIDKVFKVLSPDVSACSTPFAYILTLGERRWRKIHIPLAHCDPRSKGICINGALYYLAQDNLATYFIVCFDVRSEKFKFIQGRFLDSDSRLINYKGKLGVINWPKKIWDSRVGVYRRSKEEVRIWVLEDDDEKLDWSEYAYTLSGDKFRDVECDVFKVYVAGVTSATGEIVLMNRKHSHSEPFYVFYFHPERNVIRRVQVQGLVDHGTVLDVFVDHVDDLTFDMKSWQLDFS